MSMFSLLYSIGTILVPPATSVITHDAGYEARFTTNTVPVPAAAALAYVRRAASRLSTVKKA